MAHRIGERRSRIGIRLLAMWRGKGSGVFFINAALAGSGLAYVPEDLAQPYLAQGRLKGVLEDWCPPFPGYTSITRAAATPHRHSPCWSVRSLRYGRLARRDQLGVKFSTRSF